MFSGAQALVLGAAKIAFLAVVRVPTCCKEGKEKEGIKATHKDMLLFYSWIACGKCCIAKGDRTR